MDQKTLEEGGQNDLNFKCAKILHGADKSIACQTPEKTSEPLPTKPKEGSTELPETYKALADLFDHMSCSLRLLRLCKKSTTFQNICSQVEVLAKRKFLYTDLAKIKYILHEAIHVEKILVHDNRNLCMKPDLKITIVYEVVLGDSSERNYMALRKLFGSRLLEFFNRYPENTDIPEATLPEPFQQRAHSLICEDLPVDPSTILSPPISDQNQQLSQECKPYPVKRHFSKKKVVAETENNVASQIAQSHHSYDCLDNEGGEGDSEWQKKCTTYLKSDQEMEKEQQNESFSMGLQSSVVNTPARLICSPQSVSCGSYESSCLKIALSTDVLMAKTPAQSTPRRLAHNSDVKLNIMTTQNSISSNKHVKRVLFSHEGNYDVDKLQPSRDACDNIPEASEARTEDFDVSNSVVLSHKVAECNDCSHENTNLTQGRSTTWQQMPSSLLGLVDVIYSIFCSIKCSPITKSELLHKILMNSLDFVEMREAEEQINFLENLVPDWIYTKSGPSGDTMYCIKEVPDLESVRSRLSGNIIKAS
ncbi:hypothetical protein QN277_012151 [Acacia crassicarpa]|uniref:CDT1 Geminin-binding domain-containing protein n=1 Tax=Acacia crassicarpa TaxID=499986 RepID=A0AAE1TDF4_9FABA|nr:hypothetical protein QN277_012151 [Acacia crassicarpa]